MDSHGLTRRTFVGLLVASSASLLAACAPQSPAPSQPPTPTGAAKPAATAAPAASTSGSQARRFDGTTLNVIVMANPQSEKLKAVYASQEFQNLTGAKINVNQFSWDENRPKVLTDFTTRAGSFDLLYLDVAWLAEYAEAGLLEPLDDALRTTPAGEQPFEVEDFIPRLLENTGRHKGKTFAIPYASDVANLIYRKDLFESDAERSAYRQRYGADLRPPQTFDEFKRVAEFFTRGEMFGTTTAGRAGGFIWNRWRQYLYAWGGDVVGQDGKPTFNTPESVASMEFYRDMKKFMPPGAPSMTGGESVKVLTDGRAPMMIEWSAYAPQLAESPVADKLAWTNIPRQQRQASGTSGDSIGVYALSKNKEAAFALLRWLLNKEGVRRTTALGVTPGRVSVLNDAALQAKWPQLKPFVTTYESGTVVPEPKIATWDKMRDLIGTALSDAFTSDRPVKPIFDAAQQQLQQIAA